MAFPIDIQIYALTCLQCRNVSKGVDAKGDYVTSDTRAPNDEVEEGKDHKDTDKMVGLMVFYLIIWSTRSRTTAGGANTPLPACGVMTSERFYWQSIVKQSLEGVDVALAETRELSQSTSP